ncbi:MAG: hypothetical protein KF884_02110 [Fimbriimonadaceae bacterium]|nr:hypothetical protein [Fimbriimonadaceae bacterium]QYK58889.1 MAG: hypothetical protein KF884_02110 [Fimbriimonadaceae bacterium]
MLCLAFAIAAAQDFAVPGRALREDFKLVELTVRALHPSVNRFLTPDEADQNLERLRDVWSDSRPLGQAYLGLQRYAASFQDSRTCADPFSQDEFKQGQIFNLSNKLPFAFQWIGKRMVVTGDATPKKSLPLGTEILSIQGKAVTEIIDVLTSYVSSDGGRFPPRLALLQVTGFEEFEAFDVLYPLVFPSEGGMVELVLKRPGQTQEERVAVPKMGVGQRSTALRENGFEGPASAEDRWSFSKIDDQTAMLKLGHLGSGKIRSDWKASLSEFFKSMHDQSPSSLVIDLRGTGGDSDEVVTSLLSHLLDRPATLDGRQKVVKFQTVPEALKPFLEGADKSFFDWRARTQPSDVPGWFRYTDPTPELKSLGPYDSAYRGRVFLLVDAGTRSAAFRLAQVLKDCGRAIVVGQETGGSRRVSGRGPKATLRMPGSWLAFDFPLIDQLAVEAVPDTGVIPDVPTEPTIESVVSRHDLEVEAALKLARN